MSINNLVTMVDCDCPNCGGKLLINVETASVKCEHCGTVFAIPESDFVKIERLKSEAYRDVEVEKIRAQIELENSKNNNIFRQQLFEVVAALLIIAFVVIPIVIAYSV